MKKMISKEAIKKREYWVGEIRNLSGNFESDTERLEKKLGQEIKKYGIQTLIDHLRLCGNIPEAYSHDSSEEKLYSKYTDSLLAFAYKAIGLKSLVLKERADVADVEGYATDYSFVADAKAFRLSRTARTKKTLKSKLWTAGNMVNRMRWWFVQYINYQVVLVKFICKQRQEMFVYSLTLIYPF